MSIANLLMRNNYDLFCNTITQENPVPGPIVATDIIYHTLTQDNNNSFVDASGNTKLGNCQAGDINAVNLNASTGITSGNLGVNTTGPINCVNLTATGDTTLGDPLDNGLTFQPLTGTLSLYNDNGQPEVLIDPSNGVNTSGGTIQLTKEGSSSIALLNPQTLSIGEEFPSIPTLPTLRYSNSNGHLTVSRGNNSFQYGTIICEHLISGVNREQSQSIGYLTTTGPTVILYQTPIMIVLEPGVTEINLLNAGYFISFCLSHGIGPSDLLGFHIYFNVYIVNNTGGPVPINNSVDGKVISNTASVPNSTNIINYKFVIIDYTFVATPSVIMY